MDGLFLKQATTATKISFYHILFFMASLPFDMFYSQVILISFCLRAVSALDPCALHVLAQFGHLRLVPRFLVGHSHGKDHRTAARMGALAAAEVIQHIGARPAVSLKALAAENGLPV